MFSNVLAIVFIIQFFKPTICWQEN